MGTTIQRLQYQPPYHLIDNVKLDFDIDAQSSCVTATLDVRPNPEVDLVDRDLVLFGECLTLVSVTVDGEALKESDYVLTDKSLTIPGVNRPAKVVIVNRFSPADNTALSGIYVSGRNIVSQCESSGFRRITYFPDRPDVLSKYAVTIRAAKDEYPVLLSNGNRVFSRDLGDGRHEVSWEDPFPKPSYLFALVAGNLACRRDTIALKTGKTATLEIWVEEQDLPKTEYTMGALKRAIRWDEERFGLSLDLDLFMIVATNDFTFGAMENKGLNIFNSRLALADPTVATDRDYFNVESVVGHEYFHNWTGNRVTVRDWFQLTLKEGLTVFRDQEFSADMLGNASARAVERIKTVRFLRDRQFSEDAGPMAHPIRPESYQEVNNFYTMTVYEKGAEVVRMLHTLLGEATFRKGFDDYILTNDGKAVTCEAFIEAMERASSRSLADFMGWFSQAGTPRVTVTDVYDPEQKTYTLRFEQATAPTPGQTDKKPVLMPMAVALLDEAGRELPLVLQTETGEKRVDMLELDAAVNEFTFVNVESRPTPSLNRGFSAPILLDYDYDDEALAFLASHDSDPFNRWDAMQQLMHRTLKTVMVQELSGKSKAPSSLFVQAFKTVLTDVTLDPAFRAVVLELPSETEIAQQMTLADPAAILRARTIVRYELAQCLQNAFFEIADTFADRDEPYSPSPAQAGRRALKNLCLDYLMAVSSNRAVLTVRDQLLRCNNLTDRFAAIALIANSSIPSKHKLLSEALTSLPSEPLVANKWMAMTARAKSSGSEQPTAFVVRSLMSWEFFSLKNPNNCYSLLLTFFTDNPSEFHARDGSGYKLWVDCVLEVDKLNPAVAARLARALENWRRYVPPLAKLQYEALRQVYEHRETLSPNVFEVVDKALHNPV